MRQVVMVELGMGVDLQGQDATKAAVRAVRDAIGRNYIPGLRPFMSGGARSVEILVRLGVPAGVGRLDETEVRAALPHRAVSVDVADGGMLVPNGLGDGGSICIVNAAVEVALVE